MAGPGPDGPKGERGAQGREGNTVEPRVATSATRPPRIDDHMLYCPKLFALYFPFKEPH
jgi:hypothetical protein